MDDLELRAPASRSARDTSHYVGDVEQRLAQRVRDYRILSRAARSLVARQPGREDHGQLELLCAPSKVPEHPISLCAGGRPRMRDQHLIDGVDHKQLGTVGVPAVGSILVVASRPSRALRATSLPREQSYSSAPTVLPRRSWPSR